MKTIENEEMELIAGGEDSLAKQIGDFIGSATGWVRANVVMYLITVPGAGVTMGLTASPNGAAR